MNKDTRNLIHLLLKNSIPTKKISGVILKTDPYSSSKNIFSPSEEWKGQVHWQTLSFLSPGFATLFSAEFQEDVIVCSWC